MAGIEISEQEQNASGIPKAIFVDEVDEFMKQPGRTSAEVVLKKLEEQHNKYKFMEYNLLTKKSRLKSQVPYLKTSLDILKHMTDKKGSPEELQTHFLLSDMLYVKAKVPMTEKVCLWLGANVMLEYNLGDAQELLSRNLAAATKIMSQVEDDLGFLRDQTTTIEVNMARVYNWDVKRRHSTPGGPQAAITASS